ncbi:MAG: hypothetical protein ACM3Q2_08885 [Syntrophothermus sp.]
MDQNTAFEELQFIKRVIEDSKRSIVYNGMHYIVWGILIIAGMLLNYYFLRQHIYFNYLYEWAAIVFIGWVFSFYYSKRLDKKGPKTFALKIIATVWLAAGVAMTILGFIGPLSGAISGSFISPVLSVILGMAYLITGVIFESRWFSWLSAGWWAGAVFMFYYPGIHTLFIMALLMLFFQTLPGIILYRKYNQQMAD